MTSASFKVALLNLHALFPSLDLFRLLFVPTHFLEGKTIGTFISTLGSKNVRSVLFTFTPIFHW